MLTILIRKKLVPDEEYKYMDKETKFYINLGCLNITLTLFNAFVLVPLWVYFKSIGK